jgi:hypothetical protein
MRIFRIRSRDTRLAVMFATAPDEKTRRAFAMSTNGRQDRDADGLHLVDVFPNQRQDQVDVVDHQVQYHATSAPRGTERREAVALDEARPVHVGERAADRAIESLDVTGLDERARAIGDREKFSPLRQRARQRLSR